MVLSFGAIVPATALAPAATAGCDPALLQQNSAWLLRADYGATPLQLVSLTSPSSWSTDIPCRQKAQDRTQANRGVFNTPVHNNSHE
jgi:hypothetical protein